MPHGFLCRIYQSRMKTVSALYPVTLTISGDGAGLPETRPLGGYRPNNNPFHGHGATPSQKNSAKLKSVSPGVLMLVS